MTGWVLVVRFRSSAGPFAIREARSWPREADACSSVRRTAALFAHASSIPTDCDPCPGNTNAIFMESSSKRGTEAACGTKRGGRLHACQHRPPGEPATHALHQHQLTGPDAAVATCGIECERNAGRRSVGMFVDCHDYFFVVKAQLATEEIDDAHVCLMRHEPVDVF